MALLDLRQVIDRTGKKRATIYRDMLAGTFPKARKDGTRTVWLESDLEAWEQSLPEMGQSMGPDRRPKKKPLESAA